MINCYFESCKSNERHSSCSTENNLNRSRRPETASAWYINMAVTTHPVSATLLFLVLQAPVPAAGMPGNERLIIQSHKTRYPQNMMWMMEMGHRESKKPTWMFTMSAATTTTKVLTVSNITAESFQFKMPLNCSVGHMKVQLHATASGGAVIKRTPPGCQRIVNLSNDCKFMAT